MCNQPTPDFKNQFELEKQLHEQYAINNNAKVSSFISFIVALFALFGFYGYMYANTTIDFSKNGEFVVDTNQYTLDIFFLMSFVVCGILFFLTLLSLQLGYSQRRDQIIIHRIREFAYKNADHLETNINHMEKVGVNSLLVISIYFTGYSYMVKGLYSLQV